MQNNQVSGASPITQLDSGSRYTSNINITKTDMTATVTIDPWGDGGSGTAN